ncbi:MAG TPA: CPBP family intramembrane glutamic endopeptidase [Kribbella sp.]|nr:CPBP family intramembrane glutamic endopeptidase [Kribbella sp.]
MDSQPGQPPPWPPQQPQQPQEPQQPQAWPQPGQPTPQSGPVQPGPVQPGPVQPGPVQPGPWGPGPWGAGPPQSWSPEQPPPWGQYPPPWAQAPYGMPAPPTPRVVAAPPGVPFHQLARTALHRWWRPPVGTLFLLAVGFLTTSGVLIAWGIVHLRVTGDLPDTQGDQIFPDPTEDLAATLVILGALIPVVLLTVWVVQRRPAGSVISVLNRLRWRWLLACCLPALGYLAVSYGLSLALDSVIATDETDPGAWVGWEQFVVPALVILLLVPFQSAAEELVFRGWLVQAIGAYAPAPVDGNGLAQTVRALLRSPWPALVISSVLFVSAHGYTGWAMADIFLFAMTIGWLTIRTGGVEAAIALHALNNIPAFLLPAAVGRLDSWADQGGAHWSILAVDIPALAFYAISVQWLAGRRQLDRLTPADTRSLRP